MALSLLHTYMVPARQHGWQWGRATKVRVILTEIDESKMTSSCGRRESLQRR